MIRTISKTKAATELDPHGAPRAVTTWLDARDDRFLGVSANRKAVQVKPEPFTLGREYLNPSRPACRSNRRLNQ